MNMFDEGGHAIFGTSADALRQLKASDKAKFERIIDEASFQPMLLKVLVKEETYNNETKIRYTISRCEKMDYVAESRALLSEISACDP